MAFTRLNASAYRGWCENDMNQWFQKKENGREGVQSVQLTFALYDARDDESIEVSSQTIAKLVDTKPVPEQKSVADTELVETACTHVKGLFDDNNALLKMGQYLIETFYAGSYE